MTSYKTGYLVGIGLNGSTGREGREEWRSSFSAICAVFTLQALPDLAGHLPVIRPAATNNNNTMCRLLLPYNCTTNSAT